jgi:hypothetical protein
MNHSKHYKFLIERAKTRTLSGYKERHHIIPKCVGGTDDEDNLVDLTAREHYIAHQLLLHIYPNKGKLIYAANMMCVDAHKGRSNNRRYSWLKERFIEQVRKDATGRKASEETKAKMSAAHLGKNNSMYGKRGKDHPAFGIKPWNTYLSHDRTGYLYAGEMYDWYHETLKKYKVAGHKRFLKEKNLDLPHKLVRTCLNKISEGWNPYEDNEWLEWKKGAH